MSRMRTVVACLALISCTASNGVFAQAKQPQLRGTLVSAPTQKHSQLLAQDRGLKGNSRLSSFNSNPAATPFFSQQLRISDAARNIARAMSSVAFVEVDAKKIVIGSYHYVAGECDVAKFKVTKTPGQDPALTLLYGKQYTHLLGTTKNEQKCDGSRASAFGNFAARMTRSVATADGVKTITPFSLYLNNTPTWLSLKEAPHIKAYIAYLKNCLHTHAVSVESRDKDHLPTLVLSVKDDLFLETLDENDWKFLHSHFNVTTFLDEAIHDLFVRNRERLLDSLAAGKKGLDLNGSVLEGLFGTFEEASNFFDKKSIAITFAKKFMKKVFDEGLPVVAALATAWVAWQAISALDSYSGLDALAEFYAWKERRDAAFKAKIREINARK